LESYSPRAHVFCSSGARLDLAQHRQTLHGWVYDIASGEVLHRYPSSACEPLSRLIKELWVFTDNRIAVRFAYEWHDDSGIWFRSYGNENWEFDAAGVMQRRFACINDLPINEADRKYHWPLGRRPDDHPGLSDLGI
jgi:nuclear transport factor 2 (NTF2) superfamily protein